MLGRRGAKIHKRWFFVGGFMYWGGGRRGGEGKGRAEGRAEGRRGEVVGLDT